MHIDQITLTSPNIHQQHDFFAHTLNLPILEKGNKSLTIKIGTSLLKFRPGNVAGRYHYAIDIPENQFDQAVTWLAERLDPLADAQGQHTFYHDNIDGDSVYFEDGDGNIAEFVARHKHGTESQVPFTENNLIRICEIGLAVLQVPETVASFREQGLGVVTGEGSETFTMVGSALGVLIIVKEDRFWMPTDDTPALIIPTEVTMQGINRPILLKDLPYNVQPASKQNQ